MDDDEEEQRTMTIGRHANITGFRVIVVADGKAITHPLPPVGQISIGRFTGSKLAIDHDTLSRMHAVVRVSPDDMTIEDLGSANGTYVREMKIKPGTQTSFTTGDVVRCGQVILIFRL